MTAKTRTQVNSVPRVHIYYLNSQPVMKFFGLSHTCQEIYSLKDYLNDYKKPLRKK